MSARSTRAGRGVRASVLAGARFVVTAAALASSACSQVLDLDSYRGRSGLTTGREGGVDGAQTEGGTDGGQGARVDAAGLCGIGGRTYSALAANPTNACETCQPNVATSAWSDVTDGTPCGTGGICNTGECVSGCEVGGVYLTGNAVDPNNACQSCQPGTSTSRFTPVADTTSCGNGQVCVHGRCGTQCIVGGASYLSQAVNPANACQTCQPGTSTSQWTDSASGASCSGSGTCASGACVLPSSCAVGGAGRTNCGADAGETCCASLEVTGGVFDRTYASDPDGGAAVDPTDQASVSGFRLDAFAVTVGRFRQFVGSLGTGAGLPSPGSGKHTHLNGGQGLANVGAAGTYEPGWVADDNANVAPTDANLACDGSGPNYASWTPSAGAQENLPINCVDWAEAYAFCIWDGGFLPSETEAGYASAGGALEREYPWGVAAPGTGNQFAIWGCDYPSGTGTCSGVENLAPVGTAPEGAGLWGQLDLVGNVWGWVLDYYADYVSPCADGAQLTAPASGATRTMRGSDYLSPESGLFPAVRYRDPPLTRRTWLGFRCARTP